MVLKWVQNYNVYYHFTDEMRQLYNEHLMVHHMFFYKIKAGHLLGD
jgi:hypothetical protein